MSNVIPFKVEKTQKRYCSFCKKPEADCKNFIASNVSNHCICGVCAAEAKKRLEEAK